MELHTRFFVCITEIAAAAFLPVLADASPPSRDLTLALLDFESYVGERVAPEVPGAAIAVVADGRIQMIRTHGVRKVGSPDPITPETVFRLASVSKTFASAAAGLLVQADELSWDIPIKSHLGHVSFKNMAYGQQITVRHLLSHTTGLVPHAYTNLVEDNVPYADIIERLDRVDFIGPPGTVYSYQNVAFGLVGDLIRLRSGTPYEVFVVERLFRPLRMGNASFGLEAYEAHENRATPHIWQRNRWVPADAKTPYYGLGPSAGANASIRDMARWLLAQLGTREDVLPDRLLDALHTKVVATTPAQAHYGRREMLRGVYYGLGWRVFDFGPYESFVHHGGWIKGNRAEVVFNRNLQIGMALLTNCESRHATGVVFKFLELCIAAPPS